MACSCDDIARMIDHSLLRPELTQEDVHGFCWGSATLVALQLMHRSVSEKVKIKATGGCAGSGNGLEG